MSTFSKKYIKTILNEVAKLHNLKNITFSVQKFENITQNYFGVVIPIILSSENNQNIALVLKLAPNDERFRVSGALTLFFAREIFVYSVLLKQYSSLQENLPVDIRFIMPKYYYARDEYCKEVIVMQDMHSLEYKPYDRDMFLDIDHIIIALESLAKFHALSFALHQTNIQMFEEAKCKCVPLNETTNKRYIDVLIDRLCKALEKFNGTVYKPILEKLKHNCAKLIEATSTGLTLCICHGDIWKENILFKYIDDKPVSACIIDYQTVRVCSPAYDVLYLITSSTDTELRKTHFYKLIHVYYQKFNEMMTVSGLDADILYSRKRYELDLKVVGPACFIVANTALWLYNGLQEEGHVRSKHTWKTQEEKHSAVEKYKAIMSALLDDLSSYGYLYI